jgi:DNA-binding SARP family transcriptional activator
MRFALLGPLAVQDGAGVRGAISGARLRMLLAALLLHPGAPVSVEVLVEAVWGEAPPPGAAGTLRSYIRRLRQSLDSLETEAGGRIEAREPGYLVRVDESELDVLEFEALCRRTAAARRKGAWVEASSTAGRALALWRGEPLLDVPSPSLRTRFVPRLEELRVQLLEDRVEAELRLGRTDQLVPQLRDLVTRHPLRERFHAQLMAALAAAGRTAEALTAYQEARRVLVDELGIEPGPELRRLQERILAGAATAADESAPAHLVTVPRQLPTGVRHFAGRKAEIKALSSLLTQRPETAGAVVISAIDGTAGIGKTALAVHWAHQNADRFPDGQLYANLRGFDPGGAPVRIATVVRGFLDALDVAPAGIPLGLDAQLALYRSRLAERRMLVVLDNARDADQVRPLLPGTSGCLVLVTSRSRLTGLVALDGAVPLSLDLFTEHEARDLLAQRLGSERVLRERHAADALIDLCAGLPLAVNIVVAHAARHPDQPLAALADELRAGSRLNALTTGDSAADLRAVFSSSYRVLTAEAARVFRLLSLHPGPDVSLPAAASLVALDRRQARDCLNELTSANLIIEHAPERYTYHDLLHAFAAEQTLLYHDEDARHEAVGRMLDYYLHTAIAADSGVETMRQPIAVSPPRPGVLPEELASHEQTWRWCTVERRVLLASAALALDRGFDEHAWQLPWALANFFQWRGHWHDQIDAQNIALAAATRLGNREIGAYAHRVLGRTHTRLGSYQEAEAQLRHALELFGQLGDTLGRAHTYRGLAWVLDKQDRVAEALDCARRSLDLAETAEERAATAYGLNSVGWLLTRFGDYEQALTVCRRALDLQRELGDLDGQANALESLGYACHHLGRHAEAIAAYEQALPLLRQTGARFFEADTLAHLGDARLAAGDSDAARDCWQQALAILDDLRHPDAARVRVKLNPR